MLFMKALENRITIDPNVCGGKPTIRRKRIAVQTILEFLSVGDSIEEILENYPTLEREDIYACLRFATNLMAHKYIIEPVGV